MSDDPFQQVEDLKETLEGRPLFSALRGPRDWSGVHATCRQAVPELPVIGLPQAGWPLSVLFFPQGLCNPWFLGLQPLPSVPACVLQGPHPLHCLTAWRRREFSLRCAVKNHISKMGPRKGVHGTALTAGEMRTVSHSCVCRWGMGTTSTFGQLNCHGYGDRRLWRDSVALRWVFQNTLGSAVAAVKAMTGGLAQLPLTLYWWAFIQVRVVHLLGLTAWTGSEKWPFPAQRDAGCRTVAG